MSTKLDYDLESIAAFLTYHGVDKRMKQEREAFSGIELFESPNYLLTSAFSGLSSEFTAEFGFSFRDIPYEVKGQLADIILDDSQIERLKQIGNEKFSYIGEYEIGEFVNESGKLVVSDPCYEIGTWCMGQLENVAKGSWMALVVRTDGRDWGVRNAELHIYNKSVYGRILDWKKSEIHVGVDSGQAGFFDLPKYRNDDTAFPSRSLSAKRQEEKGEKWYSFCCDQTLDSKLSCGVVNGGVVSSSGYGDGGYSLFVAERDGQVVAAKIIFISENNEDDED